MKKKDPSPTQVGFRVFLWFHLIFVVFGLSDAIRRFADRFKEGQANAAHFIKEWLIKVLI